MLLQMRCLLNLTVFLCVPGCDHVYTAKYAESIIFIELGKHQGHF